MARRGPVLVLVLASGLGVAGCGGQASGGKSLKVASIPEAYLPPPAATAQPVRQRAPAVKPAAHHAKAVAPAAGAAPGNAAADEDPDAPTDAEVAAELKQAFKSSNGKGGGTDNAALTQQGLATIPFTAPQKVQTMIAAANQVARKPYVYGGGHGQTNGYDGEWIDSAYDCSGSVSFALAAAGFLKSPEASGPLETFGKAGPGKWVTIYASATHAWMTIAGLRFDTVGRAEHDTRWQTAGRSIGGFVVRHPAGL